jgi:hypothetical protein
VTPRRCPATAPDLWIVRCQMRAGHDGPHRNNQTIWRDPDPIDVHSNTDAWVNREVRLALERGRA